MPEYRYTAARLDGKTVRGRITAAGISSMKRLIEKDGLYLLKYRELRSRTALSPLQLSDLCRELASMLSAGITITRALDIIILRERSRTVKAALETLRSSLRGGETIKDSLQKQGGSFPPLIISMIAAGEKNGRLGAAFARTAEHYEKEHRIRSELRAAMTYPAVLAAVTLLSIIVIFTLVFPTFTRLFEGMELPAITHAMIAVSELFTKYSPLLIIAVTAVTVVMLYVCSLPSVKLKADRLKLRLPKLGRLMRIIYTSRFARTFSSMYSCGIPVIEALEASSEAVGNRYILSQLGGIINKVRSGGMLSEALSSADGFDIKLSAALAAGEESGRIDELLTGMADSFDYEAMVSVRKLLKLIEPIMIFIMAALILTVVMSVMLPIYDMYSQIG